MTVRRIRDKGEIRGTTIRDALRRVVEIVDREDREAYFNRGVAALELAIDKPNEREMEMMRKALRERLEQCDVKRMALIFYHHGGKEDLEVLEEIRSKVSEGERRMVDEAIEAIRARVNLRKA